MKKMAATMKLLRPEEYSESRKKAYEELIEKGQGKLVVIKMQEVNTMKTEDKKNIANEIIALLKAKNISEADMTKVLSCTYSLIKKKE